MKIILDEDYLLEDKDIVTVRTNGFNYTSYVKDLNINQSLIDGKVLFTIEDCNRERYCIDDYMGFSLLKVIKYDDIALSKRRSSDGDYRSNCDIIEVKDVNSDFKMEILTNFEY